MVRAALSLASRSRIGSRHLAEGLDNEDTIFGSHEHPVFDAVLMVADGMGGHPRPKDASETAVRAARQFLWDPQRLEEGRNVDSVLQGAMEYAQAAVRRLRRGPGRPPGTTLSIAVVADGNAYVSHVGDGSVYLHRDGRLETVAGGEAARRGNRPSQFLGQDDHLETEQRQIILEAGDRLLLCSDGLTRYFNGAGEGAMAEVLGRPNVEAQAVADQLTAHSRAVDYDDDTSVVLIEVTGLEERARIAAGRRAGAQRPLLRAGGERGAPPDATRRPSAGTGTQAPPPLRSLGPDSSSARLGSPVGSEPLELRGAPARMNPGRAEPPSATEAASHPATAVPRGWPSWVGAAAAALCLVGAGFLWGRTTVPTVPDPGPGVAASTRNGGGEGSGSASPPPAPPELLRQLPQGSLILLDRLNRRAYGLVTDQVTPRVAADLQLLRVGADGRIEATQEKFQLNPAHRELTDRRGRRFPVDLDSAPGAIRIVAGATLIVTGPKDAAVWVDGRQVGIAPCKPRIPAGRHRVRIVLGMVEQEAEIAAPTNGKVTLGWEGP